MSRTLLDAAAMTQSDVQVMKVNEAACAVPDASRRIFPSYIVKSFRYMLSHVLRYYANVLNTQELELWLQILQLGSPFAQPSQVVITPTEATCSTAGNGGPCGVHDSGSEARQVKESEAGATSDLTREVERAIAACESLGNKQLRARCFAKEDFLLRLACRKPQWFPVSRLEDDYSELLARLTMAGVDQLDMNSAEGDRRTNEGAYDDDGAGPDGLPVSATALIDELSRVSLPPHLVASVLSGAGSGQRDPRWQPAALQALAEVIDGTHLVDAIATGNVALAREVMACVRLSDLREMAMFLRRRRADPPRQEYVPTTAAPNPAEATGGSTATRGRPTSTSSSSSAPLTRVAAASGSAHLTARGSGSHETPIRVRGSAPGSAFTAASPMDGTGVGGKDFVIDCILSLCVGEPVFAEVWNGTVGPVVRVHPSVKANVQRLMTYFHVITDFFPLASTASGGGAGPAVAQQQPPLPASNVAVLATLGRVELPLTRRFPLFSVDALVPALFSRSGPTLRIADDVAPGDLEHAAHTLPPEMLLFESRHELDSFIAAIQLECELFDACEGYQRWRTRDADFLARVDKAVQVGLDHLLERRAAAAAAGDRLHRHPGRTYHRDTSSNRKRDRSGGIRANGAFNWPTVRSLLKSNGHSCYHLCRFLPEWRWYACVEYLYEMHQTQRNYDRANYWLRVLLERPIFEFGVGCTGGTSTVGSVAVVNGSKNNNNHENHNCDAEDGQGRQFAIYFRYQARGKWWHRLGVNLCHLRRESDALRIVETVLHDACATAVNELVAQQTARCRRLNRGRWPDAHCDLIGEADAVHRRFLRRADRMSLERLRVKLHKPPRRWGALPPTLLVSTVNEAPVVHLSGFRDTVAGGWTDEALRATACSVEDHVLRWYENGRGRREKGWRGLHCEGSWVSLLFEVIFLEAVSWSLADENDSGNSSGPEGRRPSTTDDDVATRHRHALSAGSAYLWLSPFQRSAWDAHDMRSFVLRREAVLRACLARVAPMTNEEFSAFVAARTCTVALPNEKGDDSDSDGGGGDGDEEDRGALASGAADTAHRLPLSSTTCGSKVVPVSRSAERRTTLSARAASSSAEKPQEEGGGRASVHPDGDGGEGDNGSCDDGDEGDLLVDDGDSEGLGEVCEEEDDDEVPVGQPLAAEVVTVPQLPPCSTRSLLPTPSEGYRVNVMHFPRLNELVQCVPVTALCTLFTTMLFSHPAEGHVLRFSGFPDLVLWRQATSSTEAAASGRERGATNAASRPAEFLLVEVKSPNDHLSDKQIAVNDLLLRSGFHVRVASIVDKRTIQASKAPRTRVISRYAPPMAATHLNRRTSSSFVRGTATNPVLLD